MRQPIVYILLVLANSIAYKTGFAQIQKQQPAPKVTLSGYVEDAISQERLIGVRIDIMHQPGEAFTNNFGFFSLTFPRNEVRIKCYYLGYQPIDTLIRAENDVQLTIHLQVGKPFVF